MWGEAACFLDQVFLDVDPGEVLGPGAAGEEVDELLAGPASHVEDLALGERKQACRAKQLHHRSLELVVREEIPGGRRAVAGVGPTDPLALVCEPDFVGLCHRPTVPTLMKGGGKTVRVSKIGATAIDGREDERSRSAV